MFGYLLDLRITNMHVTFSELMATTMSSLTDRSITSTCLQRICRSPLFVKTSTPAASVYRVCRAGTGFPVSKVREFIVRLRLHLCRPMWVLDGDMPESVTGTNGVWLENHSFTSLTCLILDVVAGLLLPPLHSAQPFPSPSINPSLLDLTDA